MNVLKEAVVAPSPANSHEKVVLAISDLDSTDVNQVIRGLNILTQRSFEVDANTLSLDAFPHVITALGDLLDVINPLCELATKSPDFIPADLHSNPAFREFAWIDITTIPSNHALKIAAKIMDENAIVLAILNIVRNLTFDASNELAIASSSVLMRHSVALLQASLHFNAASESSNLVFDILTNIGSKIDLNGRRRQQLASFVWLEDASGLDSKAKSALRARISNDLGPSSAQSFLTSCEILLAFLCRVLFDVASDKALLLHALELIAKLAANPDNAAIFSRCPQRMLNKLVELLCVNLTSADPFSLESSSSEWSAESQAGGSRFCVRPPACVGPFYPDFSDTELRDASIEAMLSLCIASTTVQVRLASVEHCVRLLVRIAGSSKPSDRALFASRLDSGAGPKNAAAVLALLSARPQNRPRFKALRTELCLGACSGEDLMADSVGHQGMRMFSAVVVAPEVPPAAMAVDPAPAPWP